MNKEQILQTIKFLSSSQGYYGRLYEELVDNEEVLNYLEQQNFKDAVDMILFLEC